MTGLRVAWSRPALDDPALGRRWTALWDGASPFLSWDWVGCLAAERYADPVLAEAFDGDTSLGMALFGRSGRRLLLGETGDAGWDSVFVEHNGAVAAPGWRDAVLRAVLRDAARRTGRVVVGGVDDAGLDAARGAGLVGRMQTRVAPFAAVSPDWMAGLSRNTRAQLRRSDRAYGGPLLVERARTAAEGLDWLERMLPWHARTWDGRGIRSGFLGEKVQRFHRALIGRGTESGLVAMLRLSAGAQVIGFLLNLQSGGRMATYQSGFDYAAAPSHGKPGLSCHAAAIGAAALAGLTEYDFLAGDSRSKRSLATGARALHWLEVCRPWSVAGAEAVARRILRR